MCGLWSKNTRKKVDRSRIKEGEASSQPFYSMRHQPATTNSESELNFLSTRYYCYCMRYAIKAKRRRPLQSEPSSATGTGKISRYSTAPTYAPPYLSSMPSPCKDHRVPPEKPPHQTNFNSIEFCKC